MIVVIRAGMLSQATPTVEALGQSDSQIGLITVGATIKQLNTPRTSN